MIENLDAGLAAFPDRARQSVEDFARRFMSYAKCRDTLDFFVRAYAENLRIDFARADAEVAAAAEKNGFDVRMARLLLYASFAAPLYAHYEKAGLPREVCAASLSDLYCKAAECFALYGVWGVSFPFWFPRFFDMTRFQLGRLQFETLDGGDGALNVHIPSGAPLLHDDCLASYGEARRFYKKHFDLDISAFHCYSWLLFPRLREFLPERSNILRFAADWEIYETVVYTHGEDLWRIFGRAALAAASEAERGSYRDLPEDTSLRRACKAWLLAGNALGAGRGRLRTETFRNGYNYGAF